MRYKEICYVVSVFIPELFKCLSNELPLIYWFLEFLRIIGSIYYIISYLKYQQKSFLFKAIVLFYLIIFLSTIINNSEIKIYKTLINVAFPNIGIICLTEKLLLKKGIRGLKSICIALKILVISNFLFMLIYPEGYFVTTMYSTENSTSRDMSIYFLSYKNSLIYWFIPLMTILSLIGNKKEIYFYNLIIVIQLLIGGGATSLLVFITFHLILICYKFNILRKISLEYFYIFLIIIFFAIVYFRTQTYLAPYLEDLLNKNVVELQGRTFIWEMALEAITEKWLLGYGNAGNGTIIEWNGYMWYSHNLFFDILIQGGIICLIIIITILFYIYIKFKKSANNRLYYNVLSVSIFAFLIEGIFESYLSYSQFFFILSLSTYLAFHKLPQIQK